MNDDEKDRARVAIEKQMDYLNSRMGDTSETANQFLGKFLFGGLLAVVALLNVDLVLLRELPDRTLMNLSVMALSGVGVLVISWLYFSTVVRRHAEFLVSHRKLKYKFELTLHALLCGAGTEEYARFLEMGVAEDADPKIPDHYPGGNDFTRVALYLLHHHRRRWKDKSAPRKHVWKELYFQIAMWLVVLTLGVRLASLALQ